MLPVIALVGRPNVGKSTLFNRLTRTRDALVANFSGLTRDRQIGHFDFCDKRYAIVDTGGIFSSEKTQVDEKMAEQSLQAAQEADLILWLVDARDGLTAVDAELANTFRQMNKPLCLVVNKVDGLAQGAAIAEFYRLGIEKVYALSASQGRGIQQLKQGIAEHWPDLERVDIDELQDDFGGIKIVVLGRPNVGKSTLVNRILGEERVMVFDMPGTTRDSIYIDFERRDQRYTLIDTAGIRRRKNIKLDIEKFSIVKTLQAIDDAHVVVLIMDAQEGLVDQDLHLLGMALKAGRAIVIAFNKWDGLSSDEKQKIAHDLDRKLHFIDYVKIHYISALHGSGVGNLFDSIHEAYHASQKKLATPQLTQILQGLVFDHPPPMIHGRRIKMRYAHAGGHNPPIIVIHGNQVDKVPAHYKRYLEKGFRKYMNLAGTPVCIEFKAADKNPYADKKNTLNKSQFKKRQRLKRFAYSKRNKH